MEKKKRSFKQFFQENGQSGIKDVAIEYATEKDVVNIDSLSDKYNLSTSAVKQCFEYAIVNCLVSYKTAMSMKGKAHRNQMRHISYNVSETSSDKYYDEIFRKRMSYIKHLDNQTISDVVDYYISHSNDSDYLTSYSVGYSVVELNAIIEKAIVFSIVDTKTLYKLRTIAMNKAPEGAKQVVLFTFNDYISRRMTYSNINSEIAQLHFQLESYGNWETPSDPDGEQYCERIKLSLAKAEKDLERFRNSFYE